MGKSILITGGARSGKSMIAEAMVLDQGAQPIYIATAQAFDEEMEARIKSHIERRGEQWTTLQEPLDLIGALRRSDGSGPRLVDCLTLWLSNMMHNKIDVHSATQELVFELKNQSSPVTFVTNEVGSGIVPENVLAREFRDAAGALNQAVAREADAVYLAVSGYPLQVK